jgi:hypothetical protein
VTDRVHLTARYDDWRRRFNDDVQGQRACVLGTVPDRAWWRLERWAVWFCSGNFDSPGPGVGSAPAERWQWALTTRDEGRQRKGYLPGLTTNPVTPDLDDVVTGSDAFIDQMWTDHDTTDGVATWWFADSRDPAGVVLPPKTVLYCAAGCGYEGYLLVTFPPPFRSWTVHVWLSQTDRDPGDVFRV